MAHLQTCAAPQYFCLLDIAKAFSSTPRATISEAIQAFGTPPLITQHIPR